MSTKRKLPATLARPVVKQSAKKPSRTNIDEARAAVFTAGTTKSQKQAPEELIEISSDESSNYDDVSDLEEQSDAEDAGETRPVKEEEATSKNTPPPEVTRVITNGESADVEMEEQAEEDGETFGDQVRNMGTVDVESALVAQQATPLSPLSGPQPNIRAIAPVSLASLGTVLNQALRTDDNDLLESCLQTSDYEVVMNTLNRMDSALAGKLLTKLAARMHRRPGRALGLMKWIQGTLVAHGGALASQGELTRKLADLNRVLDERSRGLTSLLALKGKLDMLDAQLRLRKANKTGGAGRRRKGALDELESDDEVEEDDDEEGIIYVEGEEEETGKSKLNDIMRSAKGKTADEEEDFPVINGVDSDSDGDSEGDDDGIEEMDDSEGVDDEEIDHNDVEESGEDESEGEAARPPAKVQKVKGSFAKRK